MLRPAKEKQCELAEGEPVRDLQLPSCDHEEGPRGPQRSGTRPTLLRQLSDVVFAIQENVIGADERSEILVTPREKDHLSSVIP